MEKLKFKGDKIILSIVILLSLLSVMMIASTGDRWIEQLRNFGVGFFLLFLFYHIDYRSVSRFATPALIFAGILLFYSFIDSSGARTVSIFGIDLQIFYFIGFCVLLYMAKYMAKKLNYEEELSQNEIIKLFVLIIVFCGGIFLSNQSTAIILFCTCIVVLFVGRVKTSYLFAFCGVIFVAVFLAFALNIGRVQTFKNRVTYWKNDKIAPGMDKDYGRQAILSRAAISTAPWLPTNVGKGTIKKVLPEKDNDYVYAVLVEEMGILVGLFVLFAYLIILYRTMRIARNADGAFGMLLAWGIGFWFCMQALVHIGVNSFLIPATGQTLPFISRGGVSLAISGAAIGMLLNISKEKFRI
ncbi:MAG: FtsW/RodA/SpoVE family cell cycle protein [Bacteroidetes bacterium]|nr:FtsW/RodA/SpoVE family cell cycle protein [Bacteroidota bacterium]MCL2302622.1 FtsW/RodA/SpoVE family cell cycle protein [Lentimicrobiaceae bacterium]